MKKPPTFQVGDIVTCYRRKQGLVYRVVEIGMDTWTQQQADWKHCEQTDVGTQYASELKLQSVFDVTLHPEAKPRKRGFRASLWQCTKVEPQKVVDLIQNLNKFLEDTWP